MAENNEAIRNALEKSPCYVEVHQSEDRLEGDTTQNVYNCARITCSRCVALKVAKPMREKKE